MTVYSPGFADIMLPVIFVLFAFALAGALIWLADQYWSARPQHGARRKLHAAPPARRDGNELTEAEARVLAAHEEDIWQGRYAREPRQPRRRP